MSLLSTLEPLPGDIILLRGTRWLNRAIRAAGVFKSNDARVDHAAMALGCFGVDQLAESTWLGVRRNLLASYEYAPCIVWRHRHLNNIQRNAIAGRMNGLVGQH